MVYLNSASARVVPSDGAAQIDVTWLYGPWMPDTSQILEAIPAGSPRRARDA